MTKVNIRGFSFDVLKPEEIIASGCAVVCVPVTWDDDMLERVAGSAQLECYLCDQKCWVSPDGQKILLAHKNPLVCTECMMSTVKVKA